MKEYLISYSVPQMAQSIIKAETVDGALEKFENKFTVEELGTVRIESVEIIHEKAKS